MPFCPFLPLSSDKFNLKMKMIKNMTLWRILDLKYISLVPIFDAQATVA